MDLPFLLIDIAGWTGVLLVLVAYALVSLKRVAGDSPAYQLLNLSGAALILFNSFVYGAYPSVGINIAWIGIAMFTLIRNARLAVNIL